jgi:hypothetical protein
MPLRKIPSGYNGVDLGNKWVKINWLGWKKIASGENGVDNLR